MVTHTWNLCSAFIPFKVHTHSSEHTHREHTPRAVGSHLCCGARGAVGGCSRAPQSWYWGWRERCTFTPPTYNSCRTCSVPCSRAPQAWYWGWRERCTFNPPTYNSCRTWDSNSQPLGYESNSLTIRPRLPTESLGKFIYCIWHIEIIIVEIIEKCIALGARPSTLHSTQCLHLADTFIRSNLHCIPWESNPSPLHC